ncbi:hypothetical protein [Marinobacter sp.]|uniref:hypothetical protein n=1 Tax=Marinobacter sp. TaxID=50741 RepID=UPI003A907C8D
MHTVSKSQKISEGDVLPKNWDAIYQGTTWSPETGFPNNHASLEILDSNSEKSLSGSGKSAVFWRESLNLGWRNWASDAQLVKLLDQGYDQLYVEFWIRFSDDWYGRNEGEFGNWVSKFFRIGSWDEVGDIYNGALGSVGPVFIWDWKRDLYGVRNQFTYRGGPHGENYDMSNKYPQGESLNFTTNSIGMGINGTDPLILDRVYGGWLKDFGGRADHNQVFGVGGNWTKMAFYVQMNSAPGVHDGVIRQWINGVQSHNREDVPWIGFNTGNKMAKWNYVAIGGNDYFQHYPNEDRYQDWYSIDNLVVRSDIPLELLSGRAGFAPNPPPEVFVE